MRTQFYLENLKNVGIGGSVVLNWVFEENMREKEDEKWRNRVGRGVWTDSSGSR
jgi:hypothetical protein